MSGAFYWLMSGIGNCRSLFSFLTPEAPVDTAAHLRLLDDKLEMLEGEKKMLLNEMSVMRVDCKKLQERNDKVRAAALMAQLQIHLQRCREIDEEAKLVLGQYNELKKMHRESDMVKQSVQTASLLKQHARQMHRQVRDIGGAEGAHTVMQDIADAQQEARDVISFASRPLIPNNIGDVLTTGIVTAPLDPLDDLDQYLGALDEGTGHAASSVQEPPVSTTDPYAVPLAS